jgi:hypothetical protein
MVNPNMVTLDFPIFSAQRYFWLLARLAQGVRDKKNKDKDTHGLVGKPTDLGSFLAFNYQHKEVISRDRFMNLPDGRADVKYTIGSDYFLRLTELAKKVNSLCVLSVSSVYSSLLKLDPTFLSLH